MSIEQPKHPSHPPDLAAEGAGGSQEERRAHAELIERLFREHNEALVRFLLARLRSRQEAYEVAQEAYVRLLSLDQPGAVSYLRGFLFKTAANLAVDRLRRSEFHGRMIARPLFHEFAETRTPDRELAGTQNIERLGRLIAALPPKCRQAFVLSRFEGKDFATIAREMKLSERMVRMYVMRALLFCRARLDLDQSELHMGSKESTDD